jgi:hypothetical protein
MAMVELYQAGDGECRPHTGRTAVGQAFQSMRRSRPSTNGERINEYGRQTAEWTAAGEAFQPVRKGRPSTNGERINEYGRQTAEWTAAGEAFQPVRRSRPSTNGERINEWGTADGRPRRAGFPVTVQNSAGGDALLSAALVFLPPSGQQEVQWSSPLGQMIPAPCQKSADIHR